MSDLQWTEHGAFKTLRAYVDEGYYCVYPYVGAIFCPDGEDGVDVAPDTEFDNLQANKEACQRHYDALAKGKE